MYENPRSTFENELWFSSTPTTLKEYLLSEFEDVEVTDRGGELVTIRIDCNPKESDKRLEESILFESDRFLDIPNVKKVERLINEKCVVLQYEYQGVDEIERDDPALLGASRGQIDED